MSQVENLPGTSNWEEFQRGQELRDKRLLWLFLGSLALLSSCGVVAGVLALL